MGITSPSRTRPGRGWLLAHAAPNTVFATSVIEPNEAPSRANVSPKTQKELGLIKPDQAKPSTGGCMCIVAAMKEQLLCISADRRCLSLLII